MSTTENLRTWFLSCPALKETSVFNTDYLSEMNDEYTIYSLPSSLDYVEDIVGKIKYNKRQVMNFAFAARLPYGEDGIQNLQNLELLANVQNWLYEQTLLQNFPEIDEGEVVSIVPVQTPYVVNANPGSAMYQIRCSLTYDRND